MIEKTLDKLTELLTSTDSNLDNIILDLLCKRNEQLLETYSPLFPDISKDYKNSCTPLSKETRIPAQFRAYASAPQGQSELVYDKKDFEDYSRLNHVLFTLSLKELIARRILPISCRKNLIYTADLRNVKDARVLVDYSDDVLLNSRLGNLICFYQNPEAAQLLLNPRHSKFAEELISFEKKPKEELRKTIINEICTWMDKYTKPFDLTELQEYKNKNYTMILIPSPIKVK